MVNLQARLAPVARGRLQAAPGACYTSHRPAQGTGCPGPCYSAGNRLLLPQAGGTEGEEGVTRTQGPGSCCRRSSSRERQQRLETRQQEEESWLLPASTPRLLPEHDIDRTLSMTLAGQGSWDPQSPGSGLPQEPSLVRGSKGSWAQQPVCLRGAEKGGVRQEATAKATAGSVQRTWRAKSTGRGWAAVGPVVGARFPSSPVGKHWPKV